MKGLFLVLEGGDGSGKSSQLALLRDFFSRCGPNTETVHFPRLEVDPYGPLIAEFLRGEFGGVDAVHPKLTALLYALDRREAAGQMRAILEAGGIILADRFIFSNVAYQCAKVADPVRRRELADWIEALEFGSHQIPRPDLTLYLDVPPAFSRANLDNARSGPDREYLQGGRDIHEDSRDLQENVRLCFLALAQDRPEEIALVDCRDNNGGMADKETIHNRILAALRHYGVINQ